MDVEDKILEYESDIKRSAYWYFGLWSRARSCGMLLRTIVFSCF